MKPQAAYELLQEYGEMHVHMESGEEYALLKWDVELDGDFLVFENSEGEHRVHAPSIENVHAHHSEKVKE